MERRFIAVAKLPFYLLTVILDGPGTETELACYVAGPTASSDQAKYVKLTISKF